jgi:hypothetical protein
MWFVACVKAVPSSVGDDDVEQYLRRSEVLMQYPVPALLKNWVNDGNNARALHSLLSEDGQVLVSAALQLHALAIPDWLLHDIFVIHGCALVFHEPHLWRMRAYLAGA